MTAPYMGGLLGKSKTPFNPTLPPGLLAMAAQPGGPAAQMAQNMAARISQQSTANVTPPPPPIARPTPPPAAPAPNAPSAATNNALMYGGIAAMRAAQGGQQGSLGAALGEGLAAGSLAFTATKDKEKDVADAKAAQAKYEGNVKALVGAGMLDPSTAIGLINLGAAEGGKLLAERGIELDKIVATARAKPETTTLVRSDGREVLVGNETGREVFRGGRNPSENTGTWKDALQLGAGIHRDTPIEELTPEQQQAATRWALEDARSRGVKITNMLPGDSKLSEHMAILSVDALGEDRTGAIQGAEQLPRWYEVRSMLKDPAYLGAGAELKLNTNKVFKDWLGIELGEDTRTNTQLIMNHLENIIIPQVKSLGFNPSDADLNAIRRAVGAATNSVEALRAIADFQIEQVEDRVRRFNRDVTDMQDFFTRKDLGPLPSNIRSVEIPRPGGATNSDLFNKYGLEQ